MTTEGGNWKALVKACTDGDVGTVRYYLEAGQVDLNFQHPEYMTTPLLEAVRNNHGKIVELLLAQGPGKIDPTIESDLDGMTPMDVAMTQKYHSIVDQLLPVLSEDYENECQRLLVTGTHHRDLLAHLLGLGHCVLVAYDDEAQDDAGGTSTKATSKLPTPVLATDDDDPDEGESKAETKNSGKIKVDLPMPLETLKNSLMEETGNSKLWFQPISNVAKFLKHEKVFLHVDAWLHKASASNNSDNQDNMKHDIVTLYQRCGLPRKLSRLVLLLESTIFAGQMAEQLSWLLSQAAVTNNEDKINNKMNDNKKQLHFMAILEPSSWWDQITYWVWWYTWCASTAQLLLGTDGAMNNNDGHNNGKIYTYNLQRVALPPTTKQQQENANNDEFQQIFQSIIQRE